MTGKYAYGLYTYDDEPCFDIKEQLNKEISEENSGAISRILDLIPPTEEYMSYFTTCLINHLKMKIINKHNSIVNIAYKQTIWLYILYLKGIENINTDGYLLSYKYICMYIQMYSNIIDDIKRFRMIHKNESYIKDITTRYMYDLNDLYDNIKNNENIMNN